MTGSAPPAAERAIEQWEYEKELKPVRKKNRKMKKMGQVHFPLPVKLYPPGR